MPNWSRRGGGGWAGRIAAGQAFAGVDMANEEHLKVHGQGVKPWNAWRESNPKAISDFVGSNLGGADLRGANILSANLHDSVLIGANISKIKLVRAILSLADLSVPAAGPSASLQNVG